MGSDWAVGSKFAGAEVSVRTGELLISLEECASLNFACIAKSIIFVAQRNIWRTTNLYLLASLYKWYLTDSRSKSKQ